MASQVQFFDGAPDKSGPQLLEGFRYQPALIGPADEAALAARVSELPFREFEFHGYLGKRRIVSFGWHYDFSGHRLRKADDIPEFLLGLRSLAASFAGLEPASLQHILVTEYGPGAGIGWHRDKAVFGQVVGVSLLAPCVLRFRRKKAETGSDRVDDHMQLRSNKTPRGKPTPRRRRQWERVNVLVEPRSAYLLSGPARVSWEHSILRVEEQRYSITFRNMRED